MNNLRDPFSLRNKPIPAFALLRNQSPNLSLPNLNLNLNALPQPLQSLQSNIEKKSQAILPAIETAVEKIEEAMSFNIPRNVPAFADPSRQLEDTAWNAVRSSNSPRSPRSGGLFSRDKELPLYKDKPYYASGALKRRAWKRKSFWGVVGLLLVGLWWWGVFESGSSTIGLPEINRKPALPVNWDDRREMVKDVFLKSWKAYEEHAWGYDVFHPVSKRGQQMVPKGMGWIIVDALDTMMIMNLSTPLMHAREWVQNTLTFEQDHEVNTFETTIRMLGGLLSAHYLSTIVGLAPNADPNDDLYLEKATDLADRLLGAYESPSGIPWASVNLKTGAGIESHADGGASSTAEAATLQLEMKYLAKLTGEALYWERAEKVMEVLDSNGAADGLVPIFVYATTGQFRGTEIRLGSRGDSYYEYLLKQYLQTSLQEPVYQELYLESLAGIKKHLVTQSHPNHLTFISELPNGIGGEPSPKMDHLVCFLPGNIALGATEGLTVAEARRAGEGAKWGSRQEEDMKLARELTRTCFEMYNVTLTGLAPEIAWFNTHHGGGTSDGGDVDYREDIVIKPRDAHNLQRPETVESLFIMYRITGDEVYREWGWKIFEAFLEHTAVEGGKGGFTSLDSVLDVPVRMRDNMESFWLAETLKYLYLLFSPDDLLPLDQVVFNTEAHPFPRFEMGKLFKTGWKRLPRDSKGKIVARD
ncbi:mannosyl-oligosaccharide alpha-1,2-mannosidase [Rhizina undulata]